MAGRGLKMEGVQIASLWVIEDVTEAQRAEAATREANARLELAQEAGHIGVFDYNLLTQRMVWSPQLEQLCMARRRCRRKRTGMPQRGRSRRGWM